MNIETVRHQISQVFPESGLVFQGTSLHRAQSINDEHGFDFTLAEGDLIDPYGNSFIFFNPDPSQFRQRKLGVLRREVGSMLGYAKHATRTDLFEGENFPVIIVAEKPKEIEIDEEDTRISKVIPIWISTHEVVKPRIIGTIILDDIPLYSHESEKQKCKVLEKIWKYLKDESKPVAPQSPAQG